MAGSHVRAGAFLRVAVSTLTLAAAACSPILGPSRQDDKNWRAHDTAHFTIYTRPASFAEQNVQPIGEALDAVYVHTLAQL